MTTPKVNPNLTHNINNLKATPSCHKFDKMMDLYVCGLLPDSNLRRLENHIEACPYCAANFAHMKETYRAMDSNAIPIPKPDWDTNWRIIRKRVLQTTTKKSHAPARGLRWGMALAGSFVIFILGIFAGRLFLNSPPPLPSEDNRLAQQLQSSMQEHIDGIKPVILQYANYKADPGQFPDVSIDREIAAQFLEKNRLLQGHFQPGRPNKNKYMLQLLEELDLILTEISNLTDNEPENLALVKELIKIKGTLLKMELIHSQPAQPREIRI